jgi:TPR repeat protein
MGYMRENGDGGLEKDPYKAYHYYYLKAAAGGDADGKAAVKRLSAWVEEESDRRIRRSNDEDNRIGQQTRRCDNWGNCTCLRGGVYMGC